MSKTKSNNNSAAAEQTSYANEYVKGKGYLNSIREFGAEGQPKRHSVKIGVMQGPMNKLHYEEHDLVVTSDFALQILLEHEEAIKSDESKVFVRFNMTNPRAKPFIYKKGKHKGEAGASIGGFLTRIMFMKIDGEEVHRDDRTFDDQNNEKQAATG